MRIIVSENMMGIVLLYGWNSIVVTVFYRSDSWVI